jgi:hypothetical protein
MNINKTGSSSILFLSNGDISSINGTDAAFLEPQNGGKTSYFGRENSTGSWVFTTAVTPYSTVIAAYNTTAPIILGHNNAEVTIANGGATTFSSSVTATSESFITGGDGAGKMLKFTGGTTKYNFMIAVQQNVNNALEITPSTAAGGSTFTTPALTIASTGAATFSSLAGVGSRTVNASATGELSAASDSRLKQEDLDYKVEGLAEILQIQPRAYKWLSDIDNRGENATTEIGFFANEIASIIPSAAPMGNDGYYGFYDRAVIAALVKGMQEQQAQIEAQQQQINSLINK